MSAIFSACGQYRMRLDRMVSDEGIVVALPAVNPSTANATDNDATIRKDIGFAKILGWRRIIKVNKFAFCATDIKELRRAVDPIGPDNDRYLAEAFDEADMIVPCWGPLTKLPKHLRRRWLEVLRIMERSGKPIMCLGTANDGQPRHTLMLPYSTPLTPWSKP